MIFFACLRALAQRLSIAHGRAQITTSTAAANTDARRLAKASAVALALLQ